MPRRLLILPLLVALSGPALAQDYVTQITGQLRDQGFGRIEVERTLLGRSRIVAQSGEGTREIIVNPRTGEILRDLWQPVRGNGASRVLGPDISGDNDADRGDDRATDIDRADPNTSDDSNRGKDSGRDDDNSGKGGNDDPGDDDGSDGNSGKDDGGSENDGSDDGSDDDG